MSQILSTRFVELLDQALEDSEAEQELRRLYERQTAVMVVDFTHMVHRTNHEGVIYALALARAAGRVMEPAIRAHGGEIVKAVADSLFVALPDPGSALGAALDALRALQGFNRHRQGHIGDGRRNDPIHACIGLGHGPALVIPGEDLFGAEVNRAFVLGEDIAGGGEILCTPRFLEAHGPLPEGIGAHAAPADRVSEAGFPFLVLRDYRD